MTFIEALNQIVYRTREARELYYDHAHDERAIVDLHVRPHLEEMGRFLDEAYRALDNQ